MRSAVRKGLAAVYGTDGRQRLREGEVRGRIETKRAGVRRIVQARFGGVPAPLAERIAAADEATLDELFERAITMPTLDAL